jgi:hypothetical protein
MHAHILLFALALAVVHAAPARAETTRVFIDQGELHYVGYLDDGANAQLFALYDSLSPKPSVLAITSRGGDVLTGLALGQWVHEHRLDIKVMEHCLSSCANYVFTAGAQKIVSNVAVIGFHGGISSTRFELKGDMKTRYDAMSTVQQEAFWAGFRNDMRPSLEREAGFFRLIGVRQDITTYGQADRFKQRVADGWTFSAEGFRQFGVDRIRVLDGPWRPTPPTAAWKITLLEVDALPVID